MQVNTNAVQDTDNDVGSADGEIRPMYGCYMFHSAEACCVNQNEVFQLHGKIYFYVTMHIGYCYMYLGVANNLIRRIDT